MIKNCNNNKYIAIDIKISVRENKIKNNPYIPLFVKKFVQKKKIYDF